MKTPITYYGGKQNMVKMILPLIPNHTIYVEPFTGGGAVYWAKEASEVEVINDTNLEVVNFYQITQKQFSALQKEIRATLHSRKQHNQAKVVYNNTEMFNPVKRAWAFWVLACQSFSSSLDGGWRYARTKQIERNVANKKLMFTKKLSERLTKTQIECADALHVIKTRDTEHTFFYCDPPYFNANMGHYKGYTEQDFINLLETLSKIKGKFMLSSYPSTTLKDYTGRFEWRTITIPKKIAILRGETKRETEVLTMNY